MAQSLSAQQVQRILFGKVVWIEIPCHVITRQSVVEHLQSQCHKEAVRIQTTHTLADVLAECELFRVIRLGLIY